MNKNKLLNLRIFFMDNISKILSLFIILIVLLRMFFINWFFVPSDSMYPLITRNSYIISNLLNYGFKLPFTKNYITFWSEPKKGDVVTFHNYKSNEILVKRIMATEGDTINFKDGIVSINGEQAKYRLIKDKDIHYEPGMKQEAYLESWKDGQQEIILKTLNKLNYKNGANNGRNAGTFTIPKGYFMAIGDNRDNSYDSRFKDIGLIPKNNIIGKVIK